MNKNKSKLLKCKICGEEFPVIATHIIRKHGLTTTEYKNRFPGSELTTEEYRQELSEKTKSRFITDPGLRKRVASRTFDFVTNQKLRLLLQRDYQFAKKSLQYELWKPAIILYASLIEAILRESTEAKTFDVALDQSLIDKTITETEYHQIHIVKESRNFVHLHKELEDGVKVINDYWAKTLSDICESIIKRFKSK